MNEIQINPFRPDSGRKEKIQIFILILLCGASKGFMKALKTIIKPFETPQRSVKTKIKLIFILMQLSKMHGAGRVKKCASRKNWKSIYLKKTLNSVVKQSFQFLFSPLSGKKSSSKNHDNTGMAITILRYSLHSWTSVNFSKAAGFSLQLC